MAAYANAIGRLVDEAGGCGLLEGLETAYIGGGTPTMLGASALSGLIGHISAGRRLVELSFEANPESLGDEVLDGVLKAGATRISIGVQSFDNRELASLGRVHDAELAEERVSMAVASGLRVSLDLMCGIPYQSPVSWEHSLKQAVSLGVGHVSCYPLIIEPGTAMERMCERGELPWPSDDTEASDMETAERELGAAGLERYEVASYARPGERCRHNIAYWTGVEYLGLGTAAASMLHRPSYETLRRIVPTLPELSPETSRVRLTITSSTTEIARACSLAELRFEVEELTAREAVAEDLMLAARMTDGLQPQLLSRARDILGQERVDATIQKLISRGLLEKNRQLMNDKSRRGGQQSLETGLALGSTEELKAAPAYGEAFVPTHSGWLLGNELYGPLWDLASE